MDFYVHLFLYLWENLYFERALHNMWSIHLSSNCAQVKRSKSKLRFTKSHFAPLQCKSMVTYDGSFNKRAFLPLAWFVIGYYGKPAPLTLAQCLIWVGSCSAKCQILDFLRSDIVFKRSSINMRCQFISNGSWASRKCIWSLCFAIGPQHIYFWSAFWGSKSLSLVGVYCLL